MPLAERQGAGRWVLVGAVAGVYLAFGVVNASLAPLLDPVRRDLGLSLSAMGLVLGAWQFVYLITAVPAGAVLDRIGPARSIAVGAAFVALSGFGRAAARGLGSLLAAVALFGIGGPLVSIGAPKLVRAHFDDDHRGVAMGVVAAAPGIGATVALVTANSVLMARTGSWRVTMAVFAGVAALACAVWVWVVWRVRVAPAFPSDEPTGVRPDGGVPRRRRRPAAGAAIARLRGGAGDLLRVPEVRRLLVAVAGAFFVIHAVGNWIVEVLRSFGASAELASLGAAVPSLVGVGSALVVPALTPPHRRAGVLVGLLVLGAVGLAALAVGPAPVRVGGLVLVGVMRGATVALLTLLIMSAPGVGDANMGVAGGLIFTAGEIGGVAGPVVVGVVADRSDGFVAALIVLVATCSSTAWLGYRAVRDQAKKAHNRKPLDFHAA